MQLTIDTTASNFVIDMTEKEITVVTKQLKISRNQLIEKIIDKYPDLKTARGRIQQALYGKQALPYLLEILPTMLNN